MNVVKARDRLIEARNLRLINATDNSYKKIVKSIEKQAFPKHLEKEENYTSFEDAQKVFSKWLMN